MTKPLTVREAADRAGVGEALVYHWCNTGQLPHYRLGRKAGRGKISIAESDLLAFLEERRVAPTPSSAPAPSPAASAGDAKQRKGKRDDFAAYYSGVMAQVARKREQRRRR